MMTRKSNYNELHENIARLKAIISLTEDAGELVDIMTKIYRINKELVSDHAVIDS